MNDAVVEVEILREELKSRDALIDQLEKEIERINQVSGYVLKILYPMKRDIVRMECLIASQQ